MGGAEGSRARKRWAGAQKNNDLSNKNNKKIDNVGQTEEYEFVVSRIIDKTCYFVYQLSKDNA